MNRHCALRGVLLRICLTLAPLLAGCGPARRSEPLKGAARIGDPEVARGRVVFMNRCNRCHPGGEAGLGPALNDKPLPQFVTKMQIRQGLGAMPAFPATQLSDADMNAVVAYVRTIRH